MKTKLFFLFYLFFLTIVDSCSIDKFEHNKIVYILDNDSGHNIVAEIYQTENQKDQIIMNNIEIWSDTFYIDDIVTNFPFFGDSVIVTYNDTVSITHYPWNWTGENVARSIMLEDNWLGGEVKDNYYRYEYTFTDADYQEALEANAKK